MFRSSLINQKKTAADTLQSIKQQVSLTKKWNLISLLSCFKSTSTDTSVGSHKVNWGTSWYNWTNPASYSKIRLPVDEAFTMNPECYQRGGFFQVERKRVWGRTWVAVGNVDDLRHPGDTIIANVGGQPIFVARDKKGNLNGFKNVCRHRGSKLIRKNGRYPVISCPYHRWGYSLNGKLLATPLWNTVEGGQKVSTIFGKLL